MSSREVNNHVHTVYSFSPYTPEEAVIQAKKADLSAVGIMDHDSVAGILEMVDAGKKYRMPVTCGFELRVNFSGTPFENRLINAPGMPNIAYIALHGVRTSVINECEDFLRPISLEREKRNIKIIERANSLLAPYNICHIDYFIDVKPLSMASVGGSVTERHLLLAVCNALIKKFGRGEKLLKFLTKELQLEITKKVSDYLLDADNPHYIYDLLGALKTDFLDSIFVQPNENECINVKELPCFAEKIGAVLAYAYLGDVEESPTGDKKAEKFEDEYLEEFIKYIKQIGFHGVTYMPPRNTQEQLNYISQIARKNELMEISGVDINSSRQVFNCKEILQPQFEHLLTATWGLIGHESVAIDKGLFSTYAKTKYPSLTDRIEYFADLGKRSIF